MRTTEEAPGMGDTKPSYWDYLRLSELLTLQGGLEGDTTVALNDELHFIVVHQVYELWFKLILAELRAARNHLAAPRVPEDVVPAVVHHLGRVSSIMKLLVEQFAVMETLTPQDFLAFRDKLTPASGFQSFQMREIEVLLGLDDAAREPFGPASALAHLERMAKESPSGELVLQRMAAVQAEATLKDALNGWLHRTPIQGSQPQDADDDARVAAFCGAYLRCMERHQRDNAVRLARDTGLEPARIHERVEASLATARAYLEAEDVAEADRAHLRRVRAALLFIESYRELPLLAWPRLLLDAVVEVEEQLILFRNRHARMVERTIGRRVGTGGSPGVDYLDRTTKARVFTDLWAVRSMLLPRDVLPPLERPEAYGFASAT